MTLSARSERFVVETAHGYRWIRLIQPHLRTGAYFEVIAMVPLERAGLALDVSAVVIQVPHGVRPPAQLRIVPMMLNQWRSGRFWRVS
jgi:hypothetical protein